MKKSSLNIWRTSLLRPALDDVTSTPGTKSLAFLLLNINIPSTNSQQAGVVYDCDESRQPRGHFVMIQIQFTQRKHSSNVEKSQTCSSCG